MANKKFSDYVVAGDNITLTYDNNADTVTIDAAGNVDSVNGKVGVVVLNKTDIGLSNVDNTSDVNKPISTATQTALDGKASTTSLNAHTSDLNNPHAVTKSQVGLANVDNTSDANKPISTATQTALNSKQDTLVSGTNIKTINSNSLVGSGNVVIDKTSIGLGNVDNTSDANKPISTATQTALNGKENTITAGTTSQYYRGDKTFQTLDKTSVGLGNVTNVDTTNASNISSGTLSDSRLSTNVTTQGNTFNAANKLVQLDASAKLPAVDGSQLTNLPTPSTPTLAQVTSAGNTTTNAISVGGLTVANYNTSNSQVKIGSFELQSYSLNNSWLGDNVYYNGTTFVARQTGTTGMFYFYQNEGQFRLSASVSAGTSVGVNNNTQLKINSDGTLAIGNSITTTPGVYTNAKFMVIGSTGNVLINTTTDAGYKLDVNGTVRIQNKLTTTGSITAASLLAQGVYFNNTLVAAANNDVLVGLDINPTFTNGAFTGVKNFGLRTTNTNVNLSGVLTVDYTNYQVIIGSGLTIKDDYVFNYSWIGTTINRPFYFYANNDAKARFTTTGNFIIGSGTPADAGYKLDVNGTMRVSGQATFANTLNVNYINMQNTGAYNAEYFAIAGTGGRFNNQGLVLGTSALNANAILQCDSTTKGVLFPRMTTTQKNAISTPAAGLVVYDTTLSKLCVYTSAWETITSI